MLMERIADYVRQGGPPMRWFALVVDRVPGARQIRALGPAAQVLWDPGTATVRVRFDRPAATLAEAIAAGVRLVEAVGLRALRVDAEDWVTLGDIAERVGRSRETVRLWALGRLGPGGFPPPLNPGRDTSFYSWAEVLPWLRERMGFELPGEPPVLAAANLVLQLRALAARVPRMDALTDLLD
jgi:hypothetical protein